MGWEFRALGRLCVFGLLSAATLLIPVNSLAQEAAANINGTVTDPTGASIPGARLTLTNLDTAVSRDAVTNDSGNYGFVDVLPANYTLKISKEGFGTVTQSRFTM